MVSHSITRSEEVSRQNLGQDPQDQLQQRLDQALSTDGLTNSISDFSQERDILPGQDIDDATLLAIQARVLGIKANSEAKNSPSHTEIYSELELNIDNVTFQSLGRNLSTGYLLGCSFFEAQTPAQTLRNILFDKDLQNAGSELDGLNKSETKLLWKETKEIIDADYPVKNLLEELIKKSEQNDLTRFETVFLKGLISGVVPTYAGSLSAKNLTEPICESERTLLAKIVGQQENNEIEIPKLTLENFRTTRYKDTDIGPYEIKARIKESRYQELRDSLNGTVDDRVLNSVDVLHSCSAREGMMAGFVVGFFGGMGTMFLSGITGFPFGSMNDWSRLDLMNRIVLPIAAIGTVIGGIWEGTKVLLNRKHGQSLEDKLNEQVRQFAKDLGDNDEAWIKEGLKRKILNPETTQVNY